MYEYETVHETRETTKLIMKITKPRTLRKVPMKQFSLDETYDYESYETYENDETLKSQNS